MSVFRSEMTGCIKCGGCQHACPVVAIEGVSHFSGPRSLVADASRFSDRLESLRGNIMMCTTCWRCEEVCPSRIPLPEAILQIRRSIYSHERLLEGHRKLVECIDIHRRSVEPRDVAPTSEVREAAEILYFPGCISEMRITSIYDSTVGILRRTGADFGVPKDWACCGAPLEKVGDGLRMQRMIEHNSERFDGFGELVTSCPGCTTQLHQHYGIEPLHTIEYLVESVGVNRLSFGSGRNLKVALHHPCHLSRTVGPHTIDYAYELLNSIPDLEVIELNDPSSCCGGGGGVVAGHPRVAEDLARQKLIDLELTGADILLAPCPFCVLNLGRIGEDRVGELITFLNAHLG